MNPGITATASSISFRLPITEVCPQLTPLLFLPTHFSLTAGTAASLSASLDAALNGGARITRFTVKDGISPEPLLIEEMSPELLKLRKSSALNTEEMPEPELVDVNSESIRSSCDSASSKGSITQQWLIEREREREIKGEEKTGKKVTRVRKIVISFFYGTRIRCDL